MNETQEVAIVLIEDDPGHAILIEKNLRRAGILNPITSLRDGAAALDFLFPRENSGKPQAPSQMLVLLDLNLPVIDGYTVLKRIKSDERTRRIPVVVLTTTDNPQEIERCYDLGCNIYITKPVAYDQFSDALKQLGTFLSFVKIPTRGDVNG
jgi:CheY-like chemotaxis protein